MAIIVNICDEAKHVIYGEHKNKLRFKIRASERTTCNSRQMKLLHGPIKKYYTWKEETT